MFKIVALLCVIGVNGQNLCILGDIPSQKFYNQTNCINTINQIGLFIDEEFKNRQIGIEMQCVQSDEGA